MASEHTLDVEQRQEEQDARSPSATRAHAAGTDPGCERETNEDRYLVAPTDLGIGYFVFDGMGGEPGGEAAAQISADSVLEFFDQHAVTDAEEALRESIGLAQRRLLEMRAAPGRGSMGTTVVGAYVNGSRVGIASVGDSRAYKISDGVIEQLTSDHTIVQQLVDAGHLDPQDALLHPQSHVLTRCLGSEISFAIDSRSLWLWPSKIGQLGDVLVLCSDGLYSMVSDQEICEIIGQMSPDAAVTRLISVARDRGGFDNITVIVVALNGKLHTRPPATLAEPEIEPRSTIDPANHLQTGEQVKTVRAASIRSNRAGFGRHIRNLVLLAGLAGFAAIVSFAILLMLRG
jgi:serine/threonine protein phosphatase PrpC